MTTQRFALVLMTFALGGYLKANELMADPLDPPTRRIEMVLDADMYNDGAISCHDNVAAGIRAHLCARRSRVCMRTLPPRAKFSAKMWHIYMVDIG
jgi:hypothetical protein